jgi:hypothetical protein
MTSFSALHCVPCGGRKPLPHVGPLHLFDCREANNARQARWGVGPPCPTSVLNSLLFQFQSIPLVGLNSIDLIRLDSTSSSIRNQTRRPSCWWKVGQSTIQCAPLSPSDIILVMCGRYRLSRRKEMIEEYFGTVSGEGRLESALQHCSDSARPGHSPESQGTSPGIVSLQVGTDPVMGQKIHRSVLR